MADKKFTLAFDAQMDVSQMKQALNQIQNSLNGLKISDNVSKSLTQTFNKLSEEIKQFEVLTSKGIDSKGAFNKLERTTENIGLLFEKLKLQIKDISSLSGESLKKLFPASVVQSINNANNALKQYNATIDQNLKKINEQNNLIQKQQDKLATRQANREATQIQLEQAQAAKTAAEALKQQALVRIQNRTHIQDEAEALKELNRLEEEATTKLNRSSSDQMKARHEGTIRNVQALRSAYEGADAAIKQADADIVSYTKSLKTQDTTITKTKNYIAELTTTLERLKSEQITGDENALNKLFEDLSKLDGIDLSKYEHSVEGAEQALNDFTRAAGIDIVNATKQVQPALEGAGRTFADTTRKVDQTNQAMREFDQRAKEIEGIKQRIQYFFGLNNAIQLARRAVRSAFTTIKELDKAMTETAVVTDFTIGDMWSQLPEYTKRANELGVTTLAAYEASTLFYQQGLKTNEVVALSNETLKMARIAGLDAAEATDRMTNALRGFNMELTETNAQRVDDVYSKLAAITASNVDEISTAMTKVASLAHNANMEFETTAAFLAQIIETTRESAETAGTALKTVIARFSEVKELYTKDELMGTDEEGEEINVNKIAKALKTAGIDLNQYFLGNVGLDTIFMELAEKWSSLTNIQQRYIATQAAGSRQQSRFIALMSDYARTQELVGAAYNANGAAATQFEKTQDSLQSKLARLKNAWDEFTMSLTNSTLVKGAVDLLTTILNIVNKLTSGFGALTGSVGGFINALLKVGAVLGARSLARGPAAVLLNSLGGLLGKGGVSGKQAYATAVFGNQSNIPANATWGTILRQQFGGSWKNLLQQRKAFLSSSIRFDDLKQAVLDDSYTPTVPKTMFGAIGNRWINKGGVGTKLSTLLGGASGAVTLGVALAGVTAAATAAYGIIKMLYDASPAGQLKAAKQFKEEIDYTRESLQATQKTLQSTLETYESQVETLKLATYGTQEWANAFSEVNNTVTDLITKFPQLVEYVTTTSDGLMQLDEKGLEAYQESIANQLKNYNALSILATGGVAQKTAATLTGSEAAAQKYIATASYQTAINSLFSDDQFGQAAKKAFAQNFDFIEWAKEAGKSVGSGTGNFLGIGSRTIPIFGKTKNQLREEYKILTGQEADEGWSKNQIADAIGQFKNLNIISKQLTEISGILTQWEKDSTVSDEVNKLLTGDQTTKLSQLGIESSNFAQYQEQFRIYENLGGSQARRNTNLAAPIALAESNFTDFFNEFAKNNNLSSEQLLTVLDASSIVEGGRKLIELISTVQSNQERFLNDTNKLFNDTFTDKVSYDLNKYLNKFTDTLKGFSGSIDPEDYYAIAEKFKQLALNSGKTATEIESFFNKFNIDSIKNDTEKLKTFYSAIASTDFSNPKEIEQLFIVLDDLGIDFSNFGSSIEEATTSVVNFADALKQTDLGQARTKAGETGAFVTNILQNERVEFTEDEFNKYLTEFADDFMQLGDAFVYIGDSITDITNQILINTQKELEQARMTAEAEIKQGLQSEVDWNELQRLNTQGYTNEEIAQAMYWQSQGRFGLPGTDFLSNFSFSDRTDLTQQGFLDLINNISTFWTTRADTEKQLNELYEYFKYTQSARGLSIKSEQDQGVITAKFRTDENAKKYYAGILSALQKEEAQQNKITDNLQQQETLAEKIALIYAEDIESVNKVGTALEENRDKLQSTISSEQDFGIANVAAAYADAYGISQTVAEEFVREYKEVLLESTEDTEEYLQYQTGLANAWIKSNVQAIAEQLGVEEVNVETVLTNIANYLQNIPLDRTIDLDADISGLLEGLNISSEAMAQFANTMGFSLTPEVQRYEPVDIFIPDMPGINQLFDMQAKEMASIGLPIIKYVPTRIQSTDISPQVFTGNTGSKTTGTKTAEPTTSTWTAEPDWLYNLNKAIEDLSDTIDNLNRDLTRALEDPNSSGNEILSIVGQLLESYYKKADLLQYEQEKYNYKAQQLLERYSNVIEFVYDSDTGEINLDTDALKDLSALDEETYNDAMELFSGLDELDEGRKQILNELNSIEDSVRSLLDYQKEAYLNLESRVIEALINERQRVIDNYSQLSDTLTSTNQDILNSLQEEISLQRQIRDNTKTEEDINAKEARLAYLRRDTTGRNELDIKKLEKELEQSRENYADSLVDQAISALQQTNAKDTEQREHQIEIMQAQLDYDKEIGAFNNEAISIITNSIDGNGKLISDSRLVDLLKTNDNWDALTAQQQKDWADDLNKNTNAAAAFLTGSDANSLSNLLEDVLGVDNPIYKWLTGDGNQSLNDMIQSIIDGINNKTIETSPEVSEENRTQQIGTQSLPAEKVVQTDAEGNKTDVTPGATGETIEGGGNQVKGKDELRTYLTEAYNGIVKQQLMGDDRKNWVRNTYGSIFADKIEEFVKSVQEIFNNIYLKKLSVQGAIDAVLNAGANGLVQFKTGGLNTTTGPAWLDGTPSKPEYVLNTDQTAAFIKLAEVLPQLLRAPSQQITKTSGDIYLDLVMNVDEIADDYDVDKIADRVKEIIYDSAEYRNVNVINFVR